MDFHKHIDTITMDCPFCISGGHRSKFLNFNIFMSQNLKDFFLAAISADPDEMPHYAAFQLGPNCLLNYLLTGIQNEKG